MTVTCKAPTGEPPLDGALTRITRDGRAHVTRSLGPARPAEHAAAVQDRLVEAGSSSATPKVLPRHPRALDTRDGRPAPSRAGGAPARRRRAQPRPVPRHPPRWRCWRAPSGLSGTSSPLRPADHRAPDRRGGHRVPRRRMGRHRGRRRGQRGGRGVGDHADVRSHPVRPALELATMASRRPWLAGLLTTWLDRDRRADSGKGDTGFRPKSCHRSLLRRV